MKQQIVAIYDKKVGAYNRPFATRTKGEAARMFTDEVNRKADDNMFNRHPEDYFLAFLGTFDDETGELVYNPEGDQVHALTVINKE